MNKIKLDPKDVQSDIDYFENKLKVALENKDWDNVIRAAKQLKLMEDAVVVYRLTQHLYFYEDTIDMR